MTTPAETLVQSPGWADDELDPWPDPEPTHSAEIARVRREVERRGWTITRVAQPDRAQDPAAARAASSLLGALGQPMRIFAGRPMWRALYSEPDRPKASSGGWGAQAAHMDFVNAELPPEFVSLYCYRPDPGGGGASVISPVNLIKRLPRDDLELLAQRAYRDGVVRDLSEVGNDINPFAVWDAGKAFPVRWTGKLLSTTDDPARRAALERMSGLLESAEVAARLEPGEMLVLDQRRVVHGRRALGERSDAHTAGRLLMHAFARDRGSSTEP